MTLLVIIITLLLYSYFSKRRLSTTIKIILFIAFITGLIFEFTRQKKIVESETLATYFQKENSKDFNNYEKQRYPTLYQLSVDNTIMEIKKQVDWFGAPNIAWEKMNYSFKKIFNFFRGKSGERDNTLSEMSIIGLEKSNGYIYTKYRIFQPQIKLNLGAYSLDSLQKMNNTSLTKLISETNEIKWEQQFSSTQQLQISLKSILTFLGLSFLTSVVIAFLPILLSIILKSARNTD